MVKIGIVVFIILIISMSIVNFIRAKKMISLAPKSIFPLFHEEWPNIYIFNGKAEKPTFQMKSWKEKRILFIISMMISILVFIFMLYSWEGTIWPAGISILIIPLNFLLIVKIPCFFVLEDGFYYEESFFYWEDIKAFSFAPVTLASEGYGMFVNSASYTEMGFYLTSSGKSKPIYVQDSSAVETLRSVFLKKGWKEISTQGEKELNI